MIVDNVILLLINIVLSIAMLVVLGSDIAATDKEQWIEILCIGMISANYGELIRFACRKKRSKQKK